MRTEIMKGKSMRMRMRKRKGQKSLEMIIGLIILLVVAGVVIAMFLNIFDPNSVNKGNYLDKLEVETKCDDLCKKVVNAPDYTMKLEAIYEYCVSNYKYMPEEENKLKDNVYVSGTGKLAFCTEKAFCFNVKPCVIGQTALDAEKCLEFMCKAQTSGEGGLSTSEAEAVIKERMSMPPGECNLKSADNERITRETWWEKYFENPKCEGTSGPGPGPSGGYCEDWCKEHGFPGADPATCTSVLGCPDGTQGEWDDEDPEFKCDIDALEGCCCLKIPPM